MRFVKVSGSWMPVDFDPHEGGNVLVWDDGRAEMTSPGGPSTGIPAGATLHYSHFATCPHAADHRRSQR